MSDDRLDEAVQAVHDACIGLLEMFTEAEMAYALAINASAAAALGLEQQFNWSEELKVDWHRKTFKKLLDTLTAEIRDAGATDAKVCVIENEDEDEPEGQ